MRASRTTRRSIRSPAGAARRSDASRADVERRVLEELEAWRERVLPDPSAPLETEDLVRLLRDLLVAMGLDVAIASGFSVNTVHYYRRKDIIAPPEGRTTAARYSLRHLWQVAGARLAGHLGLVTLAEARVAMRHAEPASLVAFVAARVADARARQLLRMLDGAPARPAPAAAAAHARPLPGRAPATPAASARSLTIALPGHAMCIIPESHAALRSPEAARELARALAAALASSTRS